MLVLLLLAASPNLYLMIARGYLSLRIIITADDWTTVRARITLYVR
jgi:hypothetical protein